MNKIDNAYNAIGATGCSCGNGSCSHAGKLAAVRNAIADSQHVSKTRTHTSMRYLVNAADKAAKGLAAKLSDIFLSLADSVDVKALNLGIELNVPEQVIAAFDWDKFNEAAIRAYIETNAPLIQAVGNYSSRNMPLDMLAFRKAAKKQPIIPAATNAPFAFDVFKPNVTDYVATHGAAMVTLTTDSTKAAIVETLQNAYAMRTPIGDIALELKNVVTGLDSNRARALAGFTQEVSSKYPASVAQVMISDKRNQLIASRCMTIARTETMHAANFGQRETWSQYADSGLLIPNQVLRTWISGGGETTCEECMAMDGETAPLDGEYEGGILGPPLHPNCACSEGLVPAEEAQ